MSLPFLSVDAASDHGDVHPVAVSAIERVQRDLGATFEERLPSPPGSWLFRFTRPAGDLVAAWSLAPGEAELPRPAAAVKDRDGGELPAPAGSRIATLPAVRYYLI